tara:strand:- start:1488 stop:2138 length:651 start_codon:yes stop_codon:yes gene_type:complete
MQWNTSGSYTLVKQTSSLAYGTGDFTIEFWAQPTVSNVGIFQQYPSNTVLDGSLTVPRMGITASGQYKVGFGDGHYENVSSDNAVDGNWHHIAIARESGTTRVFFDGVKTVEVADTHNYVNDRMVVGNWIDGTMPFDGTMNGHLYDLRVVKGTAVYTADFTPPTADLVSISGTGVHMGALSTTDHYLGDHSGSSVNNFGSIRVPLSTNAGLTSPFD